MLSIRYVGFTTRRASARSLELTRSCASFAAQDSLQIEQNLMLEGKTQHPSCARKSAVSPTVRTLAPLKDPQNLYVPLRFRIADKENVAIP